MYAIEGAALDVFLLVAIVATAVIEDPGSPLRPARPLPGESRELTNA